MNVASTGMPPRLLQQAQTVHEVRDAMTGIARLLAKGVASVDHLASQGMLVASPDLVLRWETSPEALDAACRRRGVCMLHGSTQRWHPPALLRLSFGQATAVGSAFGDAPPALRIAFWGWRPRQLNGCTASEAIARGSLRVVCGTASAWATAFGLMKADAPWAPLT